MASDWPLQSYLELGALTSAVPCARLHARQVVWEWGVLAEMAETVEVVVSELVTNAVQAAGRLADNQYQEKCRGGLAAVRLWLCSDGQQVLVQVWDRDDQMPVRQEAEDLESEGGRGLMLVERLCKAWAACLLKEGNGKVVWGIVK
jgi:anti-sigma regulatory factor (Ser/Thr protein kinase)